MTEGIKRKPRKLLKKKTSIFTVPLESVTKIYKILNALTNEPKKDSCIQYVTSK